MFLNTVAQMIKSLPAVVEIQVLSLSPGEGMANYPSILAWRIPWTEEPDGLESMGFQNWA